MEVAYTEEEIVCNNLGSKGDEMKARKIVIFGPYKSGTTGLFYKIRNSLPGNVRTLFEPTEYVPHDEDNNRWVLSKTITGVQDGDGPWRIKYETFMGFDSKIYLVRDPRDLIISGILFMVQQEPTLYDNDDKLIRILKILKEKETRPKSISVRELFEQIVEASDNHTFDKAVDWLGRQYRWLMEFESQLDDYCLIRYEDFVDGQIEDLEDYLDMRLRGKAVVDPVHDHVPRTMGYNNWKNWFLKTDIDFFKPLFEEYILHYNYPTNWQLNDRQMISPEHCSKYIERMVKKKRNKKINLT